MLERFSRALPSRSLGGRISGSRPSTAAGHKSFRLTLSGKKQMIKKGFGSYVPDKFKRSLTKLKASGASDKDTAYFLRQMKNDRTLESKEEMQKFARGFLKEAHEQQAQLREGYNPARHEYEQAQRLTKEMVKEAEAKAPKQTPTRDYEAEHQEALARVRNRLGIQHSPTATVTPAADMQNPTPLGKDHPQPNAAKPAASPSFSPSSVSFTGGRVSTGHGSHPEAGVGAAGHAVLPAEPQPSIQEPTPLSQEPTASNSAPIHEVQLPDPNDAEELPI